MKKAIPFLFLVCLLFGAATINSCKKDVVIPTLSTNSVTNITLNSATGGGNITSGGGADITARGLCYGTTQTPVIAGTHTSDGTGAGSFTSELTNLTPNTLYYVRAYATNKVGTAYGSEISFTTSAIVVATLTTTAVTSVTLTTAVSGGNITADGGGAVTAKGVCWATTPAPTITNSKTSDGTGTGSFTSNLTGLTASTTYYLRAYATNSAGTSYGNEISFNTTGIVVPTLTTTAVTAVTLVSATTGGNITADGGGAVTARGVCWALTAAPTVANSKTTDASGTGVFVSNLTGLTPGATYHLRAYATNSAGTAYGNELQFTTTPVVIPTITTAAVTSITLTTAVSGGNITANGGGAVTVSGICWATSTAPTTANSKTIDGALTGVFAGNLTGLTPGATYYVRAYATNSAGTAYGNEQVFTTSAVVVPTLTTATVTAITLTTATSGGNISSNGGGTVTASGICWATTVAPTTANFKTTDGTATGTFSSNMTGLTPGTPYHVRAYATNSAGTAYGNEQVFTTTAIVIPTLTTAAITAITTTSAVSGGNISSNGGGTITTSGICWATTTAPTTASPTKTTDGSLTGTFASNLTALTPGLTYYVRAYAINSAGTAYGNELSFTTTAIVIPTLTTTAISAVTLTSAASGGAITSNGNGTITTSGICWSATGTPSVADLTKTTNGSITGSFVSNLTGLTAGTAYHVRAYATNSAGTGYGSEIIFSTQIADADAAPNHYNTVVIGSQVWMAENLKTVTYTGGAPITNITGDGAWALDSVAMTPAYCWYNDDISNKDSHGALYNFWAVNTGDLCPTGWHVPSDADFKVLESFLGVSNATIDAYGWRGINQGAQLKSTTGWDTPNGTNTSGFNAVPGGYRYYKTGTSNNLTTIAFYWTSTLDAPPSRAWDRQLLDSRNDVFRGVIPLGAGKSVRCLKN
jgi:uncharacterized protein (TIGR02145 family)